MKTAFLIFGYSLAFALTVWVARLELENRELKATMRKNTELTASYQRCIEDMRRAVSMGVGKIVKITEREKSNVNQ